MKTPTDRDPVVATALERVAVPGHRPGFWEDLDARLDRGEWPGAVVTSIEERRPRRAPRPLFAAAAAAALLAAVAAGALVRRGGGLDVVATTPADRGPTSTAARAPDTTAAATRGEATADHAVRAWIAAVAAGDVDAGVGLVGPRTTAYMAALGADARGLVVEAGEGWGAWVDSPDMSTTEIDLGTVDGVELAVVVVSGTWSGEGEDGFRTEAMPVARSGAERTWLVEPAAFDARRGGRIEILAPAPGEHGLGGTTPDATIETHAPGAGTFYFSLDDGAVEQVAGEPSGPGVRGRWDPPGEMPSRTHLLVVAYVDGPTFTAFAGTFVVEG